MLTVKRPSLFLHFFGQRKVLSLRLHSNRDFAPSGLGSVPLSFRLQLHISQKLNAFRNFHLKLVFQKSHPSFIFLDVFLCFPSQAIGINIGISNILLPQEVSLYTLSAVISTYTLVCVLGVFFPPTVFHLMRLLLKKGKDNKWLPCKIFV